MNNFQKAIKFVLDKEGGYVNDPIDPGGETKYGISKATFPDINIKTLTLQQATEIYRVYYWNKYNLDSVPYPLCIAVFDSYVQHSPGKVSTWVRNSGGDLRSFLEYRREYYLELIAKKPALNRFKRGWMNRLNDLQKYIDILLIEDQK